MQSIQHSLFSQPLTLTQFWINQLFIRILEAIILIC